MANALDSSFSSRINEIEYPLAFKAEGGSAGCVQAYFLAFFEKVTGMPILHLFPEVAASSVGSMPIGALYTRHPEHPTAPRMSARQYLQTFPSVAARLPKDIAVFGKKKPDGYLPLMDAVKLFIGDTRLKDLLGTVSISAHLVQGGADSYVTFNRFVHPETGEITFPDSDPEKPLYDIIRGATANPFLFAPHDNIADLAIAQYPAPFLINRSRTHGFGKKGGYFYFGNLFEAHNKRASSFESGGALKVGIAAPPEIRNGIYSQMIQSAKALFDDRVFIFDIRIDQNTENAPSTDANVATPEQFERIRVMTERYIEENKDVLTALALHLKKLAQERIAKNPAMTFGIEPYIQEFPLPEITPHEVPAPLLGHFTKAATGWKLLQLTASTTARVIVAAATSEQVTKPLSEIWKAVKGSLHQLAVHCNVAEPPQP